MSQLDGASLVSQDTSYHGIRVPLVDGTSWAVLGIPGYLVSWDQGALGGWYILGCPWYPGILSIMGSGCPGWMVHPGLSLVSWDT